MAAVATRPANTYAHHDLQSEQAVLGALLAAGSNWTTDRDLADPALAMLEPGDFYRWAHQTIYRAMQGAVEAGNPPSMVFVVDALERSGTMDDALGETYLGELLAAFQWEMCYATEHARVVRTAGLQRRLGDAADTGDMAGITAATQGLAALGVSHADDYPSMREAAAAYFEMMGDESTSVVRSGLPSLDQNIGGLRPGNLIVTAARPGVGKSALGLTIAYHVAVRQSVPVAFLSLEMSHYEIMQRLIAMDASVSTQDARNPSGPVADAVGRLSDTPLYIKRPGASVAEVLAVAGPLVKQQGCKLVVIDYLQLMSGGGKSDNRAQDMATITREVKLFAQMHEVPVMLLSQLKRDSEDRNGLPRLSDIAEGDAPARDADVVLLLHRTNGNEERADVESIDLIIAKHRNGRTGAVQMQFVRETTQFREGVRSY